MKKVKTNVLRILEQKHIDYETREYDYDDEHNNGNLLNPLNHLDVNFESNSTFKLGLNKKLKLEEFIDVMNINTDCHFLSEFKHLKK